MLTTMLKAKIHQARVIRVDLEYEGSCAIDEQLMAAAGIHEYEQIQLYNLDNGTRLTTYAICAPAQSGIISINGAAAHHAEVGQRIIICAYGNYSAEELAHYTPRMIYVNQHNSIIRHSEHTEHLTTPLSNVL